MVKISFQVNTDEHIFDALTHEAATRSISAQKLADILIRDGLKRAQDGGDEQAEGAL